MKTFYWDGGNEKVIEITSARPHARIKDKLIRVSLNRKLGNHYIPEVIWELSEKDVQMFVHQLKEFMDDQKSNS